MDYKELIEEVRHWEEGLLTSMCMDTRSRCFDMCKGGECIALKAATAIETLLAERESAWWISVKERLPESGQLISYANCRATGNSYGILRVPKWETGKRYDFWMPLPEPPCYSEERGDTP